MSVVKLHAVAFFILALAVVPFVSAQAKLAGPPKPTGNHIYLLTHPEGQHRIRISVSSKEDTLWETSHTAFGSKHCEPDDAAKVGAVPLHFCAFLTRISIAIPRDLKTAPDQWEYGGYQFRLVARDVHRVISGRWHKDLYIIETEAAASEQGRYTGEASWSFVSEELGVLGFGYVHKDGYLQEPIYELQGPRGMGFVPDEHYDP